MRVLRKRLFNLLDWIVPLAPKMCIPQCKLPLAMPWKEEMMLSGKGSWKGSQHFSWNADHWFGCKPLFVLGSKAWASSVVFNQVQVGPSCWCLIFGVGRCKRFSSPLMHRFSWRLSAWRWCVSQENLLASGGWYILEVCLDTVFFPLVITCVVCFLCLWCMHVPRGSTHPLWLQMSACRLGWLAPKMFMGIWRLFSKPLHLGAQLGAALVPGWPRDTSSGERWLCFRVLCDPLSAPPSFGNPVLVSKTSYFGPPRLHGKQCAKQICSCGCLLCWWVSGTSLRQSSSPGRTGLSTKYADVNNRPQTNRLIWKLWYWLVEPLLLID